MEYEIIQFSRLRLVDDSAAPRRSVARRAVSLARLRIVCYPIRRKAQACFVISAAFSYCPCPEYTLPKLPYAADVSRVALNLLLIRLGRFIQFSGYILIVGGGDRQLFPLAGMFPQLKCLGEVLAGSP